MVAWTVKVCVLMLGFLIALQRQQCFSYATEILRALRFYKHIRRPFHFQAGITPQCSLHQFLPLQKFLNEISICCLLLSQYPTRISSCVHTELLSFRFLFLLLSSKHTQFPRCKHKDGKLHACTYQQNHGNYVIGRLSLKFSFLLRTCIFCLLQKCVIL